MQKKYKLGIIGAGSIVELTHLPILKNINQIDVSWQYDKSATRSAIVSKMFQVPVVKESELENAIKEIDICLLTIPYGVRRSFIEICAANNKSLFVEKPFATTINEHQYYCSLFPSYKLAVGFQRRYYKIIPFLKQLIKSNFFGPFKKIHLKEGYFILKGGNKFTSEVNLSGGGVIIESAIHSLDQILLITSAQDVVVKDIKSLHKNLLDYDSLFTSVIFTNNNEIPITCEISNLRNLSNGLELYFEHAIVKCQLTTDTRIKVLSSNNETIFNISDLEKYAGANSNSHSYSILWDEYINSLNTETNNLTSCNSSILTTSWIDQIYKKMKNK
jgi:predicted dehydrogenase